MYYYLWSGDLQLSGGVRQGVIEADAAEAAQVAQYYSMNVKKATISAYMSIPFLK